MTRTRPDRRTTLLTAGCIVAVILTGAFAVAANLGILDRSADTRIGTLSAAGDLLLPTATPSTEASAPALTAASATAAATPASQTYTVDVAGTVAIATDGDHITVTGVVANPGWTWAQGPAGADRVHVTFTAGARVLVFDATRTSDGTLDATVGESTATVATTAKVATVPPVDVHEHDGHEGRDDDD